MSDKIKYWIIALGIINFVLFTLILILQPHETVSITYQAPQYLTEVIRN